MFYSIAKGIAPKLIALKASEAVVKEAMEELTVKRGMLKEVQEKLAVLEAKLDVEKKKKMFLEDQVGLPIRWLFRIHELQVDKLGCYLYYNLYYIYYNVVAPKVWHDLPDSIRSSDSITSFEKNLKTYLFNEAFTNSLATYSLRPVTECLPRFWSLQC